MSCKSLHDACTPRFGNIYLSSTRFIFTEHSLNGLIELSKSTFCSCLREIRFGSCRLKKRPETVYDNTVREIQKERTVEQTEFIDSGKALQMLQHALENMKASGITNIALGIYDDVDKRKAGMLRRKGYGVQTSYGPCIPRQMELIHSFSLLRYATTYAHFPLKKLSFDLGSELGQLDKLLMSNGGDTIKHLLGLTANEPGIDIYINVQDEPSTIFHIQEKRLFLSNLAFDAAPVEQIPWNACHFGHLRQDLRKVPFEEVVIENSELSGPGLGELIDGWKHSLRRLEFQSSTVQKVSGSFFNIPGPESGSFLRYLRDGFQLESLSFSNVLYLDIDDRGRAPADILYRKYDAFDWKGDEKIREKLNEMLVDYQH